MDESNKKYEVVGTVTIGSDEYRDLIVEKTKREADADKYRSEYWKEQSRANSLEKQVAALTDELNKYKKFVKENGKQDEVEMWLFKVNRGK